MFLPFNSNGPLIPNRSFLERTSGQAGLVVLVCCWVALGLSVPIQAQGQDRTHPSVPGAREIPEALNFANGLFRERRYAMAAEEYERFLETNPAPLDAADARFGLANAQHFLQHYDQARDQFQAFLDQNPNHPNAPTALFRVGELAYVLGDLPAARKALESYTSQNPTHRYQELALPYLGDVRYRQGELDEAKQAYEQALADAPDGRLADRARLYLGRTLNQLGQPDEALERFQDLLDRPGTTYRDEAHYHLGLIHSAAGRFEAAVAAFETLEDEHPQSTLVPQAQLVRAEALARLERFEESEALLEPLLADPSEHLSARAAYALGLIRLNRGQLEAASATFDDALNRFPDTPSTPALLFRSAEALQQRGDLDAARDRYLKVADEYPEDSWADDALLQCANLALQGRDARTARRLAARFSKEHPNNPLRPNALLIEARAALEANDADDAIRLLDLLLNRQQPDAATTQAAKYYLGLAYRSSGQSEKAAEVLDDLANTPSAPVAADARFLVGQGHFEAGRHQEAVQALERYVQDRPESEVASNALAYLTLSLHELGRGNDSRAALDQLSDRFPESMALATTCLRLAEDALDRQDWDRATELFQPVADGEHPALQARARSGLGWAYYRAGQPEEAADAFGTLLERTPDDPLAPEAALVRAQALRELGQHDEALDAYNLVAERYNDSPYAAPAVLARARLLADLERPAEAAALFESYLDNPPDSHEETVDQVLAEWAWALLDAGEAEESDRVFQRLLDEYPNSTRALDARLNLAESAYQAKAYDQIADLLAPLVAEGAEVEAQFVQPALYRLGRTQVEGNDWDGAAETFDRLVSEFPDGLFRREAQFWRAEIAFQRDDAEAAEAGFDALLSEPNPEGRDPEPWLLTARLRRIQSLLVLQRWSDALEQADALKADAPDFPQLAEVDYVRGRSLQQISPPRFDDARVAYDAVIEARKGGELAARAQFMKGETYFHEKNYKQALREFLKVDLFYDAPRWQALALLEAGKVFERLDQWSDAADTYKKLQENFPDDPNASEAGRRQGLARRRGSERTFE